MVSLDSQSDPTYVGGRYDYDGPAVKEVTIEFADPSLRFALDNVTYFRPFGRARR